MYRRGYDQGNASYHALREMAMSLAFFEQSALARRPKDGYTKAAASEGSVVETVLGLCVARFADLGSEY